MIVGSGSVSLPLTMIPDPGGPKTYGSGFLFGSASLDNHSRTRLLTLPKMMWMIVGADTACITSQTFLVYVVTSLLA
jgi:hypothetical protein